MLAPATKNALPSCVHVLLPASAFHSLQTVSQLPLPYTTTFHSLQTVPQLMLPYTTTFHSLRTVPQLMLPFFILEFFSISL